MRGDLSLGLRGAGTRDYIGEWAIASQHPQPAGRPLPKVLRDSLLRDRLAEKQPRFVVPSRGDAHGREIGLGILGSIATPEPVVQPDDYSSEFVAGLGHPPLYVQLERRIARDENMSAGPERAPEAVPPTAEVRFDVALLFIRQDRKPGQRFTFGPVQSGRDAPDASLAGPQLRHLFRRKLE
jgi:hypothetical protein